MGLIFFGNERLATGVSTDSPILRGLIENGFDIRAIVSNPENAISRRSKELEIASVAHDYHIPLLTPKGLAEIKDALIKFDAEAAILVAYGKIIPSLIIDLFPKGIINIHPSLLPLHRGPTPIENVILDSSNQTGVSLMKLTSVMDAGPVYTQKSLKMTRSETKQELVNKLSQLSKTLLLNNLEAILDGKLIPTEQNHNQSTYDQLITKQDGLIDWAKSAAQIEREIRAYQGWPSSKTSLAGKEVTVTKARVIKSTKNNKKPGTILVEDYNLMVATSDGLLLIERLKPAGKKEMSAREFIIGNKNKLINQ
jgi:methionyl-tRNA formyltransferase